MNYISYLLFFLIFGSLGYLTFAVSDLRKRNKNMLNLLEKVANQYKDLSIIANELIECVEELSQIQED